MSDYREHNELAKAKVYALLTDINERLDDLVGWMDTAGFSADDIQRAVSARAEVRALHNTVVVVNVEAELGVTA